MNQPGVNIGEDRGRPLLMEKIMFGMVYWLVVVLFASASSTHLEFKYQIVYEASGIRNDGGKSYFALIKPVNLENGDFKNSIKQAIKQIVKLKGRKIIIDFFDDRNLLAAYYQAKLKGTTKSESKTEVKHHIATFSGQYQVGSFYNYICFFPGLTPTNFDPVVGEYMEWQVFDPDKDP
jgi:hypothetical protein